MTIRPRKWHPEQLIPILFVVILLGFVLACSDAFLTPRDAENQRRRERLERERQAALVDDQGQDATESTPSQSNDQETRDKDVQEQKAGDAYYPEAETLIGNWGGHLRFAEGSYATSMIMETGEYDTRGISTDPVDFSLNFAKQSDGTLTVSYWSRTVPAFYREGIVEWTFEGTLMRGSVQKQGIAYVINGDFNFEDELNLQTGSWFVEKE